LVDEPVGKINDDAGKEPGLSRAQQKTRAVKLVRSAHKTGEGGERAPGDQSNRQEQPGAPAFHQERPGNLQRKIADKKNSTRRSKNRIGQTEIGLHLEHGGREGDIRAIEIVRDVEEKKKW